MARKKTPSTINKLRGNPGKRPENKEEPEPSLYKNCPPPPDFLDAVGKKEWLRIAKELYKCGLLTVMDISALEGYCIAYSTWLKCNKIVEDTGVLIKAPSGYPVVNPALPQANKAMVEMRKWLTEFGMTPSSRANIKTTKPAKPVGLSDKLGAKVVALRQN